MSLEVGETLGTYEILGPLGAGGMGEVYRARDSKLGREVAIKVLPAALAADPERLRRFEREAKLLASLNHPNVAAVYGFEDSAENPALVMELVSGVTLEQRVAKGAIPLKEALPIAHQITAGLEYAHEHGIIHRDLKPANVKLSESGTVKILDFGLAKALAPQGNVSTGPSQAPTLSMQTEPGMILGTAAYMAPEQATGKAVDRRADIWAFGAILYEMLSGSRAFRGETLSDTLAMVVQADPDWTRLPPDTPRAVRRLLRRCLAKEARLRLRDIGDARLVLDELLGGRIEEAVSPTHEPASRTRRWATLSAGLVIGLVAGAAFLAVLDRTALAPQPSEPPTIVPLTYSGFDTMPDMSPDGKTVAFVSSRDGVSRIWLKQMSTGEEVPLTAGPDTMPRISPDGSSIAFAHTEPPGYGIYRISLLGGQAQRLAADGIFPAWSPNGKTVAFIRPRTSGAVEEMMTVPAQGGTPTRVAKIAQANVQSIAWSRDGRWIALRTIPIEATSARSSLLAINAETGAQRTIHRFPGNTIGSGLAWSGNHALLTAVGSSQASKGPFRLMRIPFGSGKSRDLMSLTALPRTISPAGENRIVVDEPQRESHLRLLELSGKQIGGGRWLSRGASVDRQPTYSPDGRWVAFTSDRGGNLDIWEISLETSTLRRLTHDAADDWDPRFSPDGKYLLWSSNRTGHFEIWKADADGSEAHQLSHDGVDAENAAITPDGKWVIYVSSKPGANGVWKMRSDGTDATRLLPGAYALPEVSPDGRWVAVEEARLSVVAQAKITVDIFRIADAKEVAKVQTRVGSLAPSLFGSVAIVSGRSRWLPNSHTLAFVGADARHPLVYALFEQPIVPGTDTSASRRVIFEGTHGAQVESFGISPDGHHLVVALRQERSDVALIEGLSEVYAR